MTNSNLLILKSLGQAINKMPITDYDVLIKAIAPYTIKTVSNKTLIWVPLASGKWDWRKYDPNKHSQYSGIGTKTSVSMEDGDIIDTTDTGSTIVAIDFPDDLDDLEMVKSLGGSTGADLMKDKKTGKLFVAKKGADNAHIKEEYMTNKIYELLGTPVPSVRFYEGINGGRNTMLSVYLDDTKNSNLNDPIQRTELKQNFIADCLLANWGIYQNDNTTFDNKTNLIVRIDNGGGLRKRAKGGDKGSSFSNNIMDDVASMKSHNSSVVGDITAAEIKSQMIDILAKKDEVLAFLEEIGESDLKNKLEKRFDSIEDKLNQVARKATEIKDLFASVKCNYDDLTDQQMTDIHNKLIAMPSGISSIDPNSSGWQFLSEVGKVRHFDGKPEILSEDDFNTMLADPDTTLAHRGVPTEQYYSQFVNSDNCWYGAVGIYGAGIYSAINTDKLTPPPPGQVSAAYKEASNGYGDYVKDIIVTKDYKTISVDDVDKMMQEEFFGDAYHKIKKEVTDNVQKIVDLEQAIKDRRKSIVDEVKDDLGFNQDTLNELNNPKFGDVDDNDINSFDQSYRAKIDHMKIMVDSIGGKYEEEKDGKIKFYLPNNQSLSISQETAKISVKQKSPFLPKYNFQYRKFQDWMLSEHFSKIDDETKARLKFDKKIKSYFGDIDMYKVMNKKLEDDAEAVKTGGNGNLHPLMRELLRVSNNHTYARGFYAILKGYDGMIEKRGNSGNPYLIMLNRAKIIVKQKELSI